MSFQETPKLSDLVHTDEIYIIFGGPSLKGFDFSKLNGKFVIGCNKAAFETKFCGGVITADATFTNSNRYNLREYRGYTIIGTKETNPSPEFGMRIVDWIQPDYLYWIDRKNRDKFSKEYRVACGENTGQFAINFAALEGFKKIHALGLDLKEPGWWHSGYRKSAGKDWMTNWAKDIDAIKPHLDAYGVKLINYNPDSAVRAYEFSDLRAL